MYYRGDGEDRIVDVAEDVLNASHRYEGGVGTSAAPIAAANITAAPERATSASPAVAKTKDNAEFAPVVPTALLCGRYLLDIILHPQLILSGILLVAEGEIEKVMD